MKKNTKYVDLAKTLRECILDGRYTSRLPGINNLSIQYSVNNRTMIKAVQLLEEQGFVHRIPSKGTFVTRLKRQRTNIIGGIFGTISPDSPLHSRLFNGISAAAQANGQSVALRDSRHLNPTHELKVARELVENLKVDGIVIWPADHGELPPTIQYLRDSNIPFVVVPEPELSRYHNCHTVSNNDSHGARRITQHLIDRGCREIGFACDMPFQGTHKLHRYDQFCAALRTAGLGVPKPIVLNIPHGAPTPHLPQAIMQQFRNLEAVVCVTDLVAIILMRECLREGIRVPTDLKVTGYDNMAHSGLLELTTIEQNFERIGSAAVRLLLDDLEGKIDQPQHLNVRSKLMIRGSTE